MNSLERSIKKYCEEHPEDPLSNYCLKGFAESEAMKKATTKRWRLIGRALQNYDLRA